MKLIDEFVQKLKTDHRLLVNRKRNFLYITHELHNPINLYVKESSLDSGFWGLNENQLKFLSSQSVHWAVVLLARSHHFGYFLKPEVVKLDYQVFNSLKLHFYISKMVLV